MNAIIAYSTLTGNTETVAEWVKERLAQAGHHVKLEEAGNIFPEALQPYDLVVLGSPTYWDGDVTDDFIPFLERMEDVDLTTKKAAVFGLGDSFSYPDEFARSVEILEKNLTRNGANLVVGSLRIDGDPVSQKDSVLKWADQLSQAL